MKKYLLDTDIGDDIDDALALDLALRCNLNLVAVTTVFRNTIDRAKITKRLLNLYGKTDIPVYYGYGSTLDGLNESFPLCQYTKEIESEIYSPDNNNPEQAVDLILECARKYGKDFVVLAIGPLTNVARAIQKDAVAMENSGGIILMGGDFVNDYAEWNILCDVTAANVVFSSKVDIIAFGHENTSKTRVLPKEQEFIFSLGGSPYREYLSELARLWHLSKVEGYRIILHDLLVIRYVLEPGYCNLLNGKVMVETSGKHRGKLTVNNPLRKSKIVRYAEDVNEREFIEYYLKMLGFEY